jgi:PAS domain S-box-containing protein
VAAQLAHQGLTNALEAERSRLAHVQSVAKIGSWETDLATQQVTWSDETFAIFEKDPGSFRPFHESFLELVHPEDRDAVEQAGSRSVGVSDVLSIQHRVLFPGGRIKHVEERWQWLADGSRAIGTCQDFSERHEALTQGRSIVEAALAATQAILDNSHDIICTVNSEGRIVQINRRAEEIWGYNQGELAGSEFLSLVHPDDRAAARQRGADIMAGARGGGLMSRCIGRDGGAIPMMWSATWSEPHGVIFAVARDMREQIAAEARLLQAQKMEAVGRLTGGVAHDFNNLLTVIVGSTEALAEGVADRPSLLAQTKLTLDAADRGAELVARLLAFSRNQPLAPQALDCNEVLEGVRQMVRRTFTEDIEVVLEKAPEGLRCMADRTQLTTALLNLCINARDAMPDGGRIILRAAVADTNVGAGTHGSRLAKPFVVLSVEDNGSGMTDSTRERATEPFFTTKKVGDGSGLGLSMVYGFASQSGGTLQIDSEVGAGTTIRLCLPSTHASLRLAPRADEPSVMPVTGRILVVEDDDLVRSQVERQLRALGHSVTVASDGVEALRLISTEGAFDLLMTDVVMPKGLNGRELAERARLAAPGMRILLTSGHNEDAFLRGNSGHGGDDFLAKPYRRRELEQKISRLLQ